VTNAALLLALAALLAIHPLLAHGNACGQDFGFHMQSWLDAAQQLRHGTLYPRWASTPAWNAGEPRFVFYPPLSWMLGALLTMLLPAHAVPIAYIFLALLASGVEMHRLARHFVSRNSALLASAFYLANPYMLFNAFERSAYAELLAAAWIPLLLLAALRERPTIRGVAVPVALLWLTNAPAAVMGCYLLALVTTLRVAASTKSAFAPQSSASASIEMESNKGALGLAFTYLAGTLLGLALSAIYLVPAAFERRYIQVEMAIIPNLRFQDNFLFAHTADAPHNIVNTTVSLLALSLLALTVAAISALLLSRPRPGASTTRTLPPLLALLTLVITLLLVPLSTPLWQHLPELAYLQFPWRLLTVLAAVLAFALALLIERIPRRPPSWTALILTLALTVLGYRLYARPGDPASGPAAITALFRAHHGVLPTDEYTPTDADNDVLRTDLPGYWLAADPNASAPNTTPTTAELNPSLQTDDTPVPDAQTLSTPAPHHLEFNLAQPTMLILHLRDYPNWRVTLRTPHDTTPDPAHIERDDGLIAIALPAGPSAIDITWHRNWDQSLGLALSIAGLLALGLTFRSRPHVESS
jgi:hypothetical protein